MSNNLPPESPVETPVPYAPAGTGVVTADASSRSNPVGIAALVAAGLLTVANVVFQLWTMNAILAGGPLVAHPLMAFVQPAVIGVLVVVTVVLGAIGTFQRGRTRIAAGVALGAGIYALVSLLTGVVVGVGYSLG
jgi:hypothetical protein